MASRTRTAADSATRIWDLLVIGIMLALGAFASVWLFPKP